MIHSPSILPLVWMRLSNQTTLRVLDVGFCGLGQEGGRYLLGVLQHNVRGPVRLR